MFDVLMVIADDICMLLSFSALESWFMLIIVKAICSERYSSHG